MAREKSEIVARWKEIFVKERAPEIDWKRGFLEKSAKRLFEELQLASDSAVLIHSEDNLIPSLFNAHHINLVATHKRVFDAVAAEGEGFLERRKKNSMANDLFWEFAEEENHVVFKSGTPQQDIDNQREWDELRQFFKDQVREGGSLVEPTSEEKSIRYERALELFALFIGQLESASEQRQKEQEESEEVRNVIFALTAGDLAGLEEAEQYEWRELQTFFVPEREQSWRQRLLGFFYQVPEAEQLSRVPEDEKMAKYQRAYELFKLAEQRGKEAAADTGVEEPVVVALEEERSEYDIVISAFALHLRTGKTVEEEISSLQEGLKPGGVLAIEFPSQFPPVIKDAIAQVLVEHGVAQSVVESCEPWRPITAERIQGALSQEALTGINIEEKLGLQPLGEKEQDMAAWLNAFAMPFFEVLPEESREGAVRAVVDRLKTTECFKEDGMWQVPYQNFRVQAFKARVVEPDAPQQLELGDGQSAVQAISPAARVRREVEKV